MNAVQSKTWICLVLALLLTVLGAACGAAPMPTELPPEPRALLQQALDALRDVSTFRLRIEQNGATYVFSTDFGDLIFRRADGQYVALDVIQARVRVGFGTLTVDADMFARRKAVAARPVDE